HPRSTRFPYTTLFRSTDPPAPTTWPVENLSTPVSSESAVVVMTFSSVTLSAAIFAGSTCTWRVGCCSFQMATLDTPGTRRMRGRSEEHTSELQSLAYL